MKVRCRKCGRIENAILTTLAAAVYDWRLGFGNDPRWRRKVYVWEHNACDLDGRWRAGCSCAGRMGCSC